MAEKGGGVLGKIAVGLSVPALLGLWGFFAPPLADQWAWALRVGRAAWAMASAASAAVWSVFAYPLPAWFAMLLAVLCWVLWTRRERPVAAASPLALQPEERALIELLAVADGEALDVEILARALNLRRFAVQHIADRLRRLNILSTPHYYTNADNLRLTTFGRDYALLHNLMGDGPLAERLQNAVSGLAEERRNSWMR